MKKIYLTLCFVVLLAVPGFAYAAPYYLTLDATVGAISDSGNLAGSANIGVGAKIQYVIEIDTDRTGFTIGQNGKPKEQRGTYYASLYAGALDGMTSAQYNYANPYYNGFYSQAGNSQSYLAINNWSGDLASLAVGSKIDSLYETAYSKSWGYTQLALKDVTVTAVSNVAPTPIPGAAVIMLGGLGVLGFLRRKFAR